MTTLEELLETAGVDVREAHEEGEVTVCCPFCPERGEGEDTRYRLGLNVINGKGHCYNCDWKSGTAIFTARSLRRIYGITFKLSERKLAASVPTKKKVKATTKPVPLPEDYEALGSGMDFVGRRVLKYLRGRDISLLQVLKHKIGYAGAGPLAWRAIFPVIGRDGRNYGYVARAVTTKQQPKYLNSGGLKMLWNTTDPACHTAVVIEGIMDALHVEQALIQTPGVAAVARLGSTITDLQLEQLKLYSKVVIFPDFDAAGLKGAIALGTACLKAGIANISVVVPKVLTGEDPGGMGEQQILEYLATATPWQAGTVYRMRLAGARRTED